jgi:hypothetical protein
MPQVQDHPLHERESVNEQVKQKQDHQGRSPKERLGVPFLFFVRALRRTMPEKEG